MACGTGLPLTIHSVVPAREFSAITQPAVGSSTSGTAVVAAEVEGRWGRLAGRGRRGGAAGDDPPMSSPAARAPVAPASPRPVRNRRRLMGRGCWSGGGTGAGYRRAVLAPDTPALLSAR